MKIYFVTILVFLSVLCQAQTIIMPENDSSIIIEYNDGKLWTYRNEKDFIVGITCYEAKDDYGKYYQIMVFIKNLSDQNVLFDPSEMYSQLVNNKNDTISLQVYTDEEFQKKIKKSQNWSMVLSGVATGINAGMAGYSTSYSTNYLPNGMSYGTITTNYDSNAATQANIAASNQMATMGILMENDRQIKSQGYLRKTTIHPDEGIVGYMNIKRKKGKYLTIYVPINNYSYTFDFDVNKKKQALQ